MATPEREGGPAHVSAPIVTHEEHNGTHRHQAADRPHAGSPRRHRRGGQPRRRRPGQRAAIWVKPEWTCNPWPPAEACLPYTPYNGKVNGKLIGILDTKGTDITLTGPLTYTQQ
ncbi:hypothetical protein AB0H17_07800 [Streptomyces olivoreticuli]